MKWIKSICFILVIATMYAIFAHFYISDEQISFLGGIAIGISAGLFVNYKWLLA